MENTQQLERPVPAHSVEEIIDAIPSGLYTEHYQPAYENENAVAEAVYELQSTETVTSPRNVDALQEKLTALAKGEIKEPIVKDGKCAEEVDVQTPIDRLVNQSMRSIEIVRNAMGKAIHILRGRGQNMKPRSSEFETKEYNTQVVSYMGDGINSIDPAKRKPEPNRMVAAAVQARDVEAGLTEKTGRHIPAAHEALLISYDMSFKYIDPKTGKIYLLSADMPWIGKRTNSLEGPHVAMLEGIANPIGVKIGPDSTPEHIAGLQERLNPDNIPGKLTFMIRIPRENQEELKTVISAIAEHAPESIVMYDIHGTTRKVGDHKVRAVSDIVEDVKMVSDACFDAGLNLHGVHLETTMDDGRMECVDTPDQIPEHTPIVDPQLNPEQFERVLKEIKPHLLRLAL